MTTASVLTVAPPEHVRSTFGLRGVEPEPLGPDWDGGWRCADVVLTPVADHARAAWSAKVRETLQVEGVRLARPVRSTDGRYVASGWRCDTFIDGTPEPRYDEVVSVANRLHAATAGIDRPRFLSQGPLAPWIQVDTFVAADRAAWDSQPMRVMRGIAPPETRSPDTGRSVEAIVRLASLRRPVQAAPQLVNGDLFGTVLFSGMSMPGITDITPYWRPAPWAAAVAVVDALSWGGADDGLLERWEELPEWPQMLLRAVMFRLAVHAMHPRSTPEAFPGLQRTADLVRMML